MEASAAVKGAPAAGEAAVVVLKAAMSVGTVGGVREMAMVAAMAGVWEMAVKAAALVVGREAEG